MEDFLERLDKLVATGISILTIPVISEDDSDLFVGALDKYLRILESVEEEIKNHPERVSKELGKLIIETHESVTARAEYEKNGVLQRMSELHRRSVMLRTYVNKLPARISITGRRQG